ncbi:hypothetical protein [Rathayibacter soli]|uniref:hypothetical protein n=1 Tax=Rathayibacter soli TaxID=3144168 RepID=UPI0027E4432D|nr:hypothetical protein [Glaciibacter superstes]
MGVIMNEAQVWSVIGVLAATLISMVVGMSTLFLRTMKANFDTMSARFETVGSEISGLRAEMNARFDAVGTRFDATDRRIEGVDRDIQTVFSKIFGTGGDRI